ncbi:MAG: hypothetical protein CR980_01840 [Propionibacteriales bacterium]|nr:MAG: hypothetical protein CR980_01840 [Propionibacteriales bacterium]
MSGQLEAVAVSVLASDPQPGTSSSLGLIGLEESARILGGNLTWAEVDGQWQVRAQVPLQQS